jgi:hypothetical protein
VNFFTREVVAMPLLSSPARFLEAPARALVLALLSRRSRQPFPFGARLLDLLERVLRVGAFQLFANRFACATRCAVLLGDRPPLRFCSLVRVNRGPGRIYQGSKLRVGLLIDFEHRV